MAFNSGYFSVSTTAAVINTDANEAPGSVGGYVVVKVPAGGATVYLGGAAVTADTTAGTGGMPVAAGETFTVPYAAGESLYAVVASSTQSVNVLRQGI